VAKLGILTGGGDCPGLNAVIRAVARRSFQRGHEVVGIRDGWRGLVENEFEPLGPREISGLLPRGGTILGTTRTNPYKVEGGVDKVRETFERAGLDALVAVGGEDTLGVATRLYEEHDFPVVGVPKTIDNDLSATDYTFGFDTAVNIAMEAIDRLHTTADSHHRVLIVEVMGRHAGWIAFHAGLSGGANVILIPEQPFDLERVCDLVGRRLEARFAPIVVVSEGAQPVGGMPETQDKGLDAFGHVRLGGVAHWLEGEIERRTGKETRATVLGHVQRGGTPTAFDRVLATRFGLHAIDAASAGEWGKMTALRGTDIRLVQLSEAVDELKTVPKELYEEAEVFFG
jgi:ATP-dependent phosphofructokinase / diphosphate-dependent phosphofructokinase